MYALVSESILAVRAFKNDFLQRHLLQVLSLCRRLVYHPWQLQGIPLIVVADIQRFPQVI